MKGQRSPAPRLLLACFFVSGATALIYELVWLRMLGLVFGHTVYAITTVLAAFMAGLGLGSFLFGRLAARLRDPIRAYGALEIGIGVYCALTPLLVWVGAFAYPGLGRLLTFSYGAFSFVQFLLVFAILLVPTTLMGGTLPLLSQALVRREKVIGRTVGMLYAVNTFGAVAGVVLAGYGLLPGLGNRSTLWLAAAANVVVGAVAIRYSLGLRPFKADAGRDRRPNPSPITAAAAGPSLPAPLDRGAWLVLAALGLSGAVSMIYEVAWTRALTLVIGSSTYAFSAMLVTFLLGIAGGAALYTWLWGARAVSAAAFGLIQSAIGVMAAIVLLVFPQFPALFLSILGPPDSPAVVQFVQLVTNAFALLPSTLFIGATFPCAVAVYARGPGRAGEDVGTLYAVNTVGAIAGVTLAGFALIPALGVHASLKVGILVNLITGATVMALAARPAPAWKWGPIGGALVASAGTLLIPVWDPRVMSSGVAIYARSYLQQSATSSLDAALRADGVLFYRDGANASVAVTRSPSGAITLRIDGKADASNSQDMPTQVMLGHLAMLLHRDPRSVLVIGLGSGVTAGMVARHPVERLDVVEIEPAVVEASSFFSRENGNVLQDPRVRLVVSDARNFLLTTSERYDLISSEPSNPWMAGIATLFTREFFELARDHLKPGGIMLQWVHGYGLYPEDLRMIVGTFGTAFPATSVWQTSAGDFLLLGRAERAPIDLESIEARCRATPVIERDLKGIGIGGCLGFLGYFVLGEADARRYSAEAAVNTDDRLALEFSAAQALYLDTVSENAQLIRRARVAELPEMTPGSRTLLERPEAWSWLGSAAIARGAYVDALAYFQRALALDPKHARALLESSKITLGLERYGEALALANKVLALEPQNAEALFAAGLASWQLNALAQAVAFLRQAQALDPQNEDIKRALVELTPRVDQSAPLLGPLR